MIDRTVIEKVRRRMAARRSKVIGNGAELVIRSRLILKGLRMPERIETGWDITRGPGGKIVGASPLAKVAGDWRAVWSRILPPFGTVGQSVLVEVKYRTEPRLAFSDPKPHQREALDTHAEAGGLSLLAWVWPGGVAIMRWPIPGFVRGEVLTREQAAELEWNP